MKLKQSIAELIENYFLESTKYQIFTPFVFYLDFESKLRTSAHLSLDPAECADYSSLLQSIRQPNSEWKLIECDIRLYGGTVLNSICPETTHIISESSRAKIVNLFQQSLGFGAKRRRVVTKKWIQESIIMRRMANEDLFHL